MEKRLLGILVGLVFSLAGVGLWILLSFAEFIAGIAGALMGVLFILGYKKINPEDKTVFPYIMSGIVILVEVIVSELVSLSILAAINDLTLDELLQIDGNMTWVIVNVAIGLVLSAVVFAGYIISARKKENAALDQRKVTVTDLNTDNNEEKE